MNLEIKENVLLKNLSTFSIGGLAKFYIRIRSDEDFKNAFAFVKAKHLSYFILGNGSNLLFDDKGYEGAILHNKIDYLSIENNRIMAGGGSLLSKISLASAKSNLSGLEYFSAIPASVGGAIFMNAGAEGWSISSFIENVTFMHEDGKIQLFDRNQIKFDYRYSSFKELKGAIIAATFLLQPCDGVEEKRLNYLSKRNKNQPIKTHNAGCVFKNPKDNFAGMLIDKCGLKGKAVGGAKVSELHANFIINEKNASSKDVSELIFLIKKHVKEKYSIDLEEEILLVDYSKGTKKDGLSS